MLLCATCVALDKPLFLPSESSFLLHAGVVGTEPGNECQTPCRGKGSMQASVIASKVCIWGLARKNA